jgi:hypothetical protein
MLKVDLSTFTARQQLSTKLMRPAQRHQSSHDMAMRHRHSRRYVEDVGRGAFEPTDEAIDAMNLMPNFRGVRLRDFKSGAGGKAHARPSWRERSLERLRPERRDEIAREARRAALTAYNRRVMGEFGDQGEEQPGPAAPASPAPLGTHEQLRKQCCLLHALVSELARDNEILRAHLDLMANARKKLELRERAARTRRSDAGDGNGGDPE